MGTYFRNATLVQLDPPSVESGDLRQENGVLCAVGSGAKPQAGDEVVECEGAVLMPGLVNGHTHLYSALAAGMPAPSRGNLRAQRPWAGSSTRWARTHSRRSFFFL